MTSQDQRYTSKQAAAYLGLEMQTLNRWRSEGGNGLPFYKIGRKIIYKHSDLEAFFEASRVEGKQV